MKTILFVSVLSVFCFGAAQARSARVSAAVMDPGCEGTPDWHSAPRRELDRRLLAEAKKYCAPLTFPMLHDVKYSCAQDLLSGSGSWYCTW